MRYIHALGALLLGLMILALPGLGRNDGKADEVESADVDRFWAAYDRIVATSDDVDRRRILQREFLDPGSAGLKAFMQAKGYDAD